MKYADYAGSVRVQKRAKFYLVLGPPSPGRTDRQAAQTKWHHTQAQAKLLAPSRAQVAHLYTDRDCK